MDVGAVLRQGPPTGRHRALDDHWNRVVSRLLHRAALVRDRHERVQAVRGALADRRQTAAILDLIRTRGQPRTKHYLRRPVSGRRPGPVAATPEGSPG